MIYDYEHFLNQSYPSKLNLSQIFIHYAMIVILHLSKNAATLLQLLKILKILDVQMLFKTYDLDGLPQSKVSLLVSYWFKIMMELTIYAIIK